MADYKPITLDEYMDGRVASYEAGMRVGKELGRSEGIAFTSVGVVLFASFYYAIPLVAAWLTKG